MKRMIASTGTHGTGKSMATSVEYRHQKMICPGFSVGILCDLEAGCPFPINQDSTEDAQKWLFYNHMEQELVFRNKFDVVVVDRTIVDVVAYTEACGYHDLAERMLAMVEEHVRFYDQIFFRQIKRNPYCFDDGIRAANDESFRLKVENILMELYGQLSKNHIGKGVIQYV